jgi:transposase
MAPRVTQPSAQDLALLTAWARSRTQPLRVVLRSRIVLLLAGGQGVAPVADALGVSHATVRRWARRFVEQGAKALLADAPGRGRKPVLDAATRQALRDPTVDGDAMSVRARARALGVSAATVSRWRRRGASP